MSQVSKVRSKFIVDSKSVTRSAGNTIKLVPVVSGSEENKQFYKYTPAGIIEIGTINDEAAALFEVGKEYYIDFTKAGE